MAPHHAHSNMNGASDERPATWAAPAGGVIVPFIARVGSKSPSILSPVTTSIDFVFLLICLEFLNDQVILYKRGWPASFSSHAALTTPGWQQQSGCVLVGTPESNSTGRNRPVLPCHRVKGNYQAKVTTPQIGHRAQLQAEST
jgi:hypothetical protein